MGLTEVHKDVEKHNFIIYKYREHIKHPSSIMTSVDLLDWQIHNPSFNFVRYMDCFTDEPTESAMLNVIVQ